MSIRTEIEAAIRDYETVFPVPYALAPNLDLANRALAEASGIIVNLVDDELCEWDHNHSCQAHGDFYVPQGEKCATQAGRDFIA